MKDTGCRHLHNEEDLRELRASGLQGFQGFRALRAWGLRLGWVGGFGHLNTIVIFSFLLDSTSRGP